MTVLTIAPGVPAEERRGGVDPDWDRTRPGEELPAKEEPEFWDPPEPEVLDDVCPADECETDRDLRHDRGVRDDGELHRRVGVGWTWCGTPGCGGDLGE